MLTGSALAGAGGAFSGVLGRGVAHLTIYLPALALYLIVLPRIYGFATLGHLPQIFALATVFLLATSFIGQAIGAWFTRPENATLLLLATSLPQFFTAGFAWPREAIPDAAIALGRMFPADSAIDGLVRVNQLGASIWEVAHDWLGLWCLALGYFALAVISAFAVKRRRGHAQGWPCRRRCDRARARRGRPDLFVTSFRVNRPNCWRRADDRSQGRAGGERPTDVDCGRERRASTLGRYPGEPLRGGTDGTGGPGAGGAGVGDGE